MAFDPAKFLGFSVNRVLSIDKKTKSIALLGHFQNEPENDVVVLADKLPITSDSIRQLFEGKVDQLKNVFWNDIYGQLLGDSCGGLGDVKVTVVYPASEKHIAKYTTQEQYMVTETPVMYERVTKPYIQTQALGLEWVYNILDGTSEADRVLYKDPHPLNGFVILPDLKWDSQDVDSLYVIAIVNRRDVLSLRDVNGEHLELLRSIQRQGKEVIKRVYGLRGDQLRCYIHYQPSFYHLHVHITNIKYDSPGTMVGRAHLLDDVIDNIETIDKHYYQKRTMSFVLKETHCLTTQYKEHSTISNGTIVISHNILFNP